MQLTNILRDVGEDARRGRLYLPLDELAAFGCDPEAILCGRPSGRFRELLAFQVARARDLYVQARRGIPALSPAGRLTTLAASEFYATILTAIEERDYDVFGARAYVPNGRKLAALPGVAAAFVRLAWPRARREAEDERTRCGVAVPLAGPSRSTAAAIRSSTILAEQSTPGRPAPGCVPAPTK